jgi:hypothetical protein
MRYVQRKALPRTYWCVGDATDALKAGTNGQNDWWRIWTWTGIRSPVAIMSEERAEWGRRWQRFGLFALGQAVLAAALLWIFSAPWVLWAVVLPPAVIAARWTSRDQRGGELFGHAVAVQVGVQFEGEQLENWEDRHVRSLMKYETFRSDPKAGLTLDLQARYLPANRWIRDHRKLIEEYLAFVAAVRADGP